MKKTFLIIAVMAIAVSASYVFAGQHNNTPTTISVGSTTTTMYGSLEATRNTSDSTAILFCTTSNLGTEGRCVGTTPSGTRKVCYTTNPSVIDQIKSVSSSSYIYVIFNNSTSQITTLSVTNGSHLLP